jgi:hypothetical protein
MDPVQQTYVQKLFQDVSNALSFFTTPEFLVLCLLIAVIVIGVRKTIEFITRLISDKYIRFKSFINSVSFNYFYSEMLIPAMPLIVGGIFTKLVTSYPYPENFKMAGGRIGLGIIAGLFSAFVYPRAMYLFKQLQKVPTQPEIVRPDVPVQPEVIVPAINPVMEIPTTPIMPVINRNIVEQDKLEVKPTIKA